MIKFTSKFSELITERCALYLNHPAYRNCKCVCVCSPFACPYNLHNGSNTRLLLGDNHLFWMTVSFAECKIDYNTNASTWSFFPFILVFPVGRQWIIRWCTQRQWVQVKFANICCLWMEVRISYAKLSLVRRSAMGADQRQKKLSAARKTQAKYWNGNQPVYILRFLFKTSQHSWKNC